MAMVASSPLSAHLDWTRWVEAWRLMLTIIEAYILRLMLLLLLAWRVHGEEGRGAFGGIYTIRLQLKLNHYIFQTKA